MLRFETVNVGDLLDCKWTTKSGVVWYNVDVVKIDTLKKKVCIHWTGKKRGSNKWVTIDQLKKRDGQDESTDDEDDENDDEGSDEEVAEEDDDDDEGSEDDDDTCKKCAMIENNENPRGLKHAKNCDVGKQPDSDISPGDRLVKDNLRGKVVSWDSHACKYKCTFPGSSKYITAGSVYTGEAPTEVMHGYEMLTISQVKLAKKRKFHQTDESED